MLLHRHHTKFFLDFFLGDKENPQQLHTQEYALGKYYSGIIAHKPHMRGKLYYSIIYKGNVLCVQIRLRW